MIGMKDQCFGVEVEMTGITRRQAAQALANYFGTTPYYTGGTYDKWCVKDTDGKVWSLMSDGSIRTEAKTEMGYDQTYDGEYSVEMVTPKLTYEELPKLQECVRKMVDTYGGLAPHGGGALSGKDGTKVDRSGAYMARYIAKNIVAAGLAKRCTVSLAYAIGKAQPVMVDVNTHGTGKFSDAVLEQAVRVVFNLTPDGMIGTLGLDRPIFRRFCNYGHFMHDAAPWEQTDMIEVLECACRAKETGCSQR